ncbi:MAG: LptF/LptG family permease [Bacteroidota bacterium]|nr:LptF/LptG family permease [Bacteroidota bacterium]
MKKLYRLIITSFLGPFVMTFFIALFILLMQFLWKYIDDLVGKGLEWTVIARLLIYASATFVPLALPLAMLLSSIMTFGNLGENYELVAIKAAGVSLIRTLYPLMICSFIIAIGAFYFSNNILPVANLKMGSLLYDVRQQKPAINIKPGMFYSEIDNYVIKIGKKEDDGKILKNIMIYDHTEGNGNTNVTLAEEGRMEFTPDKMYMILTLKNGNSYIDIDPNSQKYKNQPFQRMKFKEQTLKIDVSSFTMTRTNEELFKDNYQMLNIKQLNKASDSLTKTVVKYKKEYSQNFLSNYYFYNNYYKGAKDIDTSKIVKDSVNINKSDKDKLNQMAVSVARNVKEGIDFQKEFLKEKEKLVIKHKVEWHRKFTLSLACMILFFIGAPLGAIIRKGGFGMPVVVSVFFFIIYHVISITGEKFVKEGVIPPYEGMWIASLVYIPISILLTYKAINDSTLLDQNIYHKLINRLFDFRKKILKHNENE